ncbi:DUF523 domain-containing protein [Noviherbaspirillum sp.]|uniref:DUF523 domain-containing protein n=1 Tax=Noviherbaspirillum sp. TaxID=1926288 RepID=UPI002D7093B5|nr:DUF523 domain-containing protein [Noviherbaspirillum sp.]HZW20329.1 DUF523 domain-containing protein [Noviherbaspirillum sp.]
MKKILVSTCLGGIPVRYDGRAKSSDDAIIARWRSEGRLIHVCPEVSAGFPVPRPPAEIAGGDGHGVLHSLARVVENNGRDVTSGYLAGARHALALARESDIAVALLADGSPSCGSRFIYSGDFSGRRKEGMGVTAALLESHGIKVFSHERIAEADAYLRSLEQLPG